jgi:hypothetical protein
MHGCQALQPHAARNLLKGRGVAVAGYKSLKEVENLFLSSSDSHGRIIANKKRTATILFSPSRARFQESQHWDREGHCVHARRSIAGEVPAACSASVGLELEN